LGDRVVRREKKGKWLAIWVDSARGLSQHIFVLTILFYCRHKKSKSYSEQPPSRPPSVILQRVTPQRNLDEDMASVIEENDQKTAQINRLQATLRLKEEKEAAAAAPSLSKKPRNDANDAVIVLLKETLKEKVWPLIKFVSSDKQMQQLAMFTLKQSGLQERFNERGQITTSGREFVDAYAGTVNKLLNDHRSSCQNSMKEVTIAYMTANRLEELPDNEEFLKILRRDKDVNKDLFVWWWDVYLPKAAGSAKVWNHTNKFYGLISEHHPPGKPDNLYITPSTEAWGMLLIENCRKRWPKLKAIKQKGVKLVYTKGKSKTPAKPGTKQIDVSAQPEFLGTYTNCDAGQKKFGGWSSLGLRRFADLVKMNKHGRKKETTVGLEQAVLDLVRSNHDITCDTWEEEKRKSRGSKPPPAPAEEIVDLFDLDEIGLMEAV